MAFLRRTPAFFWQHIHQLQMNGFAWELQGHELKSVELLSSRYGTGRTVLIRSLLSFSVSTGTFLEKLFQSPAWGMHLEAWKEGGSWNTCYMKWISGSEVFSKLSRVNRAFKVELGAFPQNTLEHGRFVLGETRKLDYSSRRVLWEVLKLSSVKQNSPVLVPQTNSLILEAESEWMISNRNYTLSSLKQGVWGLPDLGLVKGHWICLSAFTEKLFH